jgi:3-hydroxyacyl-[acyl-carrier-protein] dehydratase
MLDIKEIMRLLPHRYPFLLVDRVLETVPQKRIVAIKNVTINEPFFQGHFPGEPIMPGVLIVEAMAQTWGILLMSGGELDISKNSNIRFLGIDNCRFRRAVVPGDQLRFELEAIAVKRGIWKFGGKAYVGDEVAAEAELMATM